MTVLRALVRLIGVLWAVALALLALGIALFCLDGLVGLGRARPDRLAHLATARRSTGRFLAQLEAPGHVAVLSLLCGLGAVAVGLVLLRGIFGRSRERLVVLDGDSSAGVLAARRRAIRQMLETLAGDVSSVSAVRRVRLGLRRRGEGGRVRLDVARAPDSEEAAVERSVERALAPLAEPFGLERRVRARRPHGAPDVSRTGTP